MIRVIGGLLAGTVGVFGILLVKGIVELLKLLAEMDESWRK